MIRDSVRSQSRSRSGITLVEILISILIMGIGVISIATLFPLGLIRLRNAQRLTRGAYLVESATADLGARNLLSGFSFLQTPFYQTGTSGAYNPLFFDTLSYGADWGPAGYGNTLGANRYIQVAGSTQLIGAGLPVAYDPLWRCVTGVYPDPIKTTTAECRFGSGVGFLRDEGGTPVVNGHAHGLQRVTNFQTNASAPLSTVTISQAAQQNLAVLGIFVSPEDVIVQEKNGQYPDPNSSSSPPSQLQNPSTIVPDLQMGSGTPMIEWRDSWLFTGQQSDQSSTDVDGEIVVCENRPFALDVLDTTNFPNPGSYQISGETVVEAIWGFSSSPAQMLPGSTTQGYGGLSASRSVRSVLLRWPVGNPDPDVRVGGWIADVTYERSAVLAQSHFGTTFPKGVTTFNGLYPAQRCYWYQIAKKSEITDDPTAPGFRMMTVWTTTPLRALTLLKFNAGAAATAEHIEAALIMPSVINVYPRTVYTR